MARLIVAVLILPVFAFAQLVEKYRLANYSTVEKVVLDLNGGMGDYHLLPTHTQHLLYVISDDYQTRINPHLHSYLKNNVYYTVLNLISEDETPGLSTALSNRFFSTSSTAGKKTWKVLLGSDKPYELSLNYDMGKANVNLSGLTVEKLNINSESADVAVSYDKGKMNRAVLDTFFIQVELGQILVENIGGSNARVVKADVGFGNLVLNYDDVPNITSEVIASIGAGTFEVKLPSQNIPVRVNIHDSPLCKIKFDDSFTRQAGNVFVNDAYITSPADAIEFDIDVTLGKIIFSSF